MEHVSPFRGSGEDEMPSHFQLKQNLSNPFNPVSAKGLKAAGRYHVVFDAHNLASGVYIYRLSTDKGFVQSKKMMLIR